MLCLRFSPGSGSSGLGAALHSSHLSTGTMYLASAADCHLVSFSLFGLVINIFSDLSVQLSPASFPVLLHISALTCVLHVVFGTLSDAKYSVYALFPSGSCLQYSVASCP